MDTAVRLRAENPGIAGGVRLQYCNLGGDIIAYADEDDKYREVPRLFFPFMTDYEKHCFSVAWWDDARWAWQYRLIHGEE
jgi:glycosyltransferase involved in cell wall biosynthesis